MKNLKICALALSAGFILCSASGCVTGKKTNGTAAGSSVASTVEASSEAASSETTRTPSESENATAAKSEKASEPAASGDSVKLSAERQEYANGFLTAFARQYISHFDASTAGVDQYVDFAHIYFVINGYRSISIKTKGELSFEVFSFDDANSIVAKYFGIMLKEDDCKKLPAPPTAHGDQPAGPYFEEGNFWYEAAGGEGYNILAVVDSCKNNGDGTHTLQFSVYMVESDDYSKDEGFKKYLKLTPSEAKKDKTLKKTATGTAKVDVGESGDYVMKYYRSNNV
ncbi:MAG: hypothetical protein J5623_01985 [Clostridiales bacterium]|nr:hypothetical protein [Clostridiales bacterium]